MSLAAVGPREKAIFSQTLAPMIRGLEQKQVVVELKNELVVVGKLIVVDCFMNLTMENVSMTRSDGAELFFEMFFVQGKQLRCVRIPNQLSMTKLLKDQLAIVTGYRLKQERQRAKDKRANYLKKKEIQNMSQPD